MRPKASSFGGHAKVYTPSKQVEYENWVRLCFKQAYPNAEPFSKDEELTVRIEVQFAVPKSFSKKKRAEALSWYMFPKTKPDLDNCIKSVLDALNGIAFADDAQIVDISAIKTYERQSSVHVEITNGCLEEEY